jgi:hypothetical protein
LPQGEYNLKVERRDFVRWSAAAGAETRPDSVGRDDRAGGRGIAESITVTGDRIGADGEPEFGADRRQASRDDLGPGPGCHELDANDARVSSTNITSMGGATGTPLPNINGTRAMLGRISVDGQQGTDDDSGIGFVGPVSMDFIQEVKVLANNYQAEYGGNSGGLINIVQKSGGSAYHGNLSWFTRNEALNANDFFNNRNRLRRPLYRFNTFTATGRPGHDPQTVQPQAEETILLLRAGNVARR